MRDGEMGGLGASMECGIPVDWSIDCKIDEM